jgi:thymidine kinase
MDKSPSPHGKLRMKIGAMFSNKSEGIGDEIKVLENKSVPYVVFKWDQDARYKETVREAFSKGYITMHEGGRIPAICIGTAEDIKEYLINHPKVKDVYVGEGQFISGLFDVARELISKGYNLRIDALARDARRKPFGDVPKLMCLADDIDMCYAICVDSFEPATESYILDQSTRTQVKVGGKGDYEAKSLKHWSSEREEPLKYQFEMFKW